MADRLSRQQRSRNMAAIKGKDTKPELNVRKFLYANGLRYRLHYNELPGKPDMVLPKYRTAIFVNGCYWHRHPDCKYAYTPKSNQAFWEKKLQGNVERDRKNYTRLNQGGWRVIVIWECEIKNQSYQQWLLSVITAQRH